MATFFNQKLKLISVCFISTTRVNGTLRSGSEMLFRTLSLKKNTSCLGFCTFGVFSNTSFKKGHALSQILHFSGTFEHAPLGSCSEKEHTLSQILHFSGTFEHVSPQFPRFSCTFRQLPNPARISPLPNLFFPLAISFSPADQQHCQHKE